MGRISRIEHQHGAPDVFDVVHARFLRFFPDIVADLGGDPAALLARVGLDLHNLSQAGHGATYRQIVQLLDIAATELHCPEFGLRLAKLQAGGAMFGPLGRVMMNSATFGDAIRYVTAHAYAHSLAARLSLRRSPSEKTVFAGYDILLDRLQNKTQAVEQALLLGHQTAMELTDGAARARAVHCRHQPVGSPRAYRRYFGCDVLFDQAEDGLVFAEKDLACAIIAPDVQAYRSATAYIETVFTCHKPPLRAQARGLIMQFLGTEDCTNERVAAELNLHPRTLHRRLGVEGTSFQQIRDEVRRDIMLYYLQHTDLGLAFISEKLGFAEQSVMSRRCHRWFSASPTKVRSQARQQVQAA